jgi:hypothetical protein
VLVAQILLKQDTLEMAAMEALVASLLVPSS